MKSVSPVFEDLAQHEMEIGGPTYETLHAVLSQDNERRVTVRFELDEAERQAIANGADLLLTVLTFGNRLQPICPWVADRGTVVQSPQRELIEEIVGIKVGEALKPADVESAKAFVDLLNQTYKDWMFEYLDANISTVLIKARQVATSFETRFAMPRDVMTMSFPQVLKLIDQHLDIVLKSSAPNHKLGRGARVPEKE